MTHYRAARCAHGFLAGLCVDDTCEHYDGAHGYKQERQSRGVSQRRPTLQCMGCRRRVPRELLGPNRRCGCEISRRVG